MSGLMSKKVFRPAVVGRGSKGYYDSIDLSHWEDKTIEELVQELQDEVDGVPHREIKEDETAEPSAPEIFFRWKPLTPPASLVSSSLVSVQPLSAPTGSLNYIEFKYNDEDDNNKEEKKS